MTEEVEGTEEGFEAATQADLLRWSIVKAQVAPLVAEEMMLRKKIFGTYFKTPKEGVNDHPLANGYVMKGTHKINRNVDEALLAAKQQELIDAGIPMGELIKMKPELVTKSYRVLQANKENCRLFEQILDIKVGAPELKIVKPAK